MFRTARPVPRRPARPVARRPARPVARRLARLVPLPALRLWPARRAPAGRAVLAGKRVLLRAAAARRALETPTVRWPRFTATSKAAFASSVSRTLTAARSAFRDVTRRFIAASNAASIKTAKRASSASSRFGAVPKPARQTTLAPPLRIPATKLGEFASNARPMKAAAAPSIPSVPFASQPAAAASNA
jgi:hypothetical protein